MAFSRSRIRQAELLLTVSDAEIYQYKDRAKSLIRSMNYYYLSPIFLISRGPSLKHQLEAKYKISDSFKCCDLLTGLLTVPFTDEIFVGTTFVTGIIMLCLILLPFVQKAAYEQGYNTIYGSNGDIAGFANSVAFEKAGGNSECNFCTQEIDCRSANSTLQCSIGPIKYNVYSSNIECPLIASSGIASVLNASSQSLGTYVDPTSFIDNTYMTYTLWGDFNLADWFAIRCNRTFLAQKRSHNTTVTWIWAIVGIIIAAMIIYFIINTIFCFCHPVIGIIYPENYRLVRIDDNHCQPPFKPITKSINV